MSSERFSLEHISKIAWAKSSSKVLDFFHVLDKYITDEDVTTYLWKTEINTVGHTILREDIINESTEEVKQIIIANFPEKKERLIVVHQII